jgi:DNA repair exonuclease SbcCD nuclease subunit
MFKFLHTSDIHLDSPLRGFQRHDNAPIDDFRNVTRRALENLITLAIDEKVDFILVSGDLYDGDWKDFNTGLFLIRELAKLLENNIRVFIPELSLGKYF